MFPGRGYGGGDRRLLPQGCDTNKREPESELLGPLYPTRYGGEQNATRRIGWRASASAKMFFDLVRCDFRSGVGIWESAQYALGGLSRTDLVEHAILPCGVKNSLSDPFVRHDIVMLRGVRYRTGSQLA